MKKFIVDMIKKSIPFVIGLFIGAGLTKNKYVWTILIVYIILVFIIRLLAKKMMDIKSSVDKKIAARNASIETLNSAIEYMDYAFIGLWGLFDKLYPTFIFFVGLVSFICIFVFIWLQNWLWAVIMFTLCILFTVLNQIWRKVKYLGEKENAN